MEVKKFLTENKIKKYKIINSNYNSTIDYYKKCLKNDEMLDNLFNETEKVGKGTNTKIAPQEKLLIDRETKKKKIMQLIKETEDKNKKYYTALFLLDEAITFLEQISTERAYIIKCRYIKNMSWSEIDIDFNSKCRKNIKTIGYAQLSKMRSEGIEIMQEFIDSFPLHKVENKSKLKNI